MHFYNDNDVKTAAWLGELVARRHLPPGDINTTSINDLATHDFTLYTQCHFFAGIGGWPLALRLAGWPDDQPVWTGSCPCQPFSVAGRGGGTDDPRHLWPAFLKFITIHRPPVIFGEQVAGKAGRLWLAGIRADLEALGYAVAAADLCAAGVGAPHIRQRIYWMAYAQHAFRRPLVLDREAVSHGHDARWPQAHSVTGACGEVCASGMDNTHRNGTQRSRAEEQVADAGREDGRLADTELDRRHNRGWQRKPCDEASQRGETQEWPLNLQQAARHRHDFWSGAVGIPCLDSKSRVIEPSSFPLAHGIPENLACMFARKAIAWADIQTYAERHKTDPHEILRMVREAIQQGQGWKEPSTGVCVEFHAPTLLLDFLLGVETALNPASDGRSIQKEGAEIVGRAVRIMRGERGDLCPPCGWEPTEQREDEPATALQLLPLILARHTQAYREAVLSTHAALNRVTQLRAYGNAIVPPLAAEFIIASVEAINSTLLPPPPNPLPPPLQTPTLG